MKTRFFLLAFVMLASAGSVCFGQQKVKTKTYKVKDVSFTMVYVEGGEAVIGLTSEFDQRDIYDGLTISGRGAKGIFDNSPVQVTLDNYWIGQTEVTQELWMAVMGSNPSMDTSNPKMPVFNVSWDDCMTFVTRLSSLTGERFRMPTEAEWEYAARGGMHSQFYRYSGSNDFNEVGWEKSRESLWDFTPFIPHTVATKKPNEIGLYDMTGNVYEWCKNGTDYISFLQSGNNPQGCSNCGYRVFRGAVPRAGVFYRGIAEPGERYEKFGFRLAKSEK